jgi:hypothetical protein
MSKTLSELALDMRRAFDELERKEKESEQYKVIVHPSVISYDYRIAWTWEEMEKRNEYNNNVDSIRISS